MMIWTTLIVNIWIIKIKRENKQRWNGKQRGGIISNFGWKW